MKCENCSKKIKKNDSYFKVYEYKDGKLILKKFVHKKCQDDYIKLERKLKIAEGIIQLKKISERGLIQK